MDKLVGHFLEQPNFDFPLDCELQDAMQTNTAMVGIIGNIAGDKAILRGCEIENAGANRKPGYIFLRTADYPDGEVLYFEGGAVASGMYLKKEAIAVSAQGYDYPQAYTKRSLAPGIGDEQYNWSDFRPISTIPQLEAKNAAQDTVIAALKLVPLGVIQIWAGDPQVNIPADYLLCDGRTLAVAEYPELYAAIGRLHTASGVAADRFALPDLRGRFIVGYNHGDNDYNEVGNKGGEKAHMLTYDELARHSHGIQDKYQVANALPGDGVYNPSFIKYESTTSGSVFGASASSGSRGSGFLTIASSTDVGGMNKAHENRPPYYTLAYIMRVK